MQKWIQKMKISENNGTMTIVMCNGKVSNNMKTRKEKTRKHEVIEGGEITCNCNVSISLLAIDWVEGYEPERGGVWYGFTPFGCYTVYQDSQNLWILEGMHQDGEEEYESLEDAVDGAQSDYVSRLSEVLGGRVNKLQDRIIGSWDSDTVGALDSEDDEIV